MDATILSRLLILTILMLTPVIVILGRTPRLHREVWANLRALLRRPWARLVMIAAVGVTALGQAQLTMDPFQLRPDLTALGVGAVCFWLSWRWSRPGHAVAYGEAQPLDLPLPDAPGNPQAAERRRGVRGWLQRVGWRWALGGLAFALSFWLGERIAPHFLERFRLGELVVMGEWPTYAEQLGLWVAATALLVIAVSPRADFAALARELRESWRSERREWLLVAGCTAAALLLRVVSLETSIPIVFGDESSFARQGGMVSEGYRAIIFAPAHLSHPWVYSVAIAPFVSLLGRNLTGLRMASAAAGALTVPAVYLLARWTFDRRVAAAAMVFVAGWSVHVHFSRIALNNIVDPLFGALAFALLWRGLQRGGRLHFALAGIALGLSQYFYVGARLYPLVMAAYVASLAIFQWRRVRSQWRGLAVLALAFLLVTFPANYFLLVKDLPLTTRPSAVSILQPREDHGGLSPFQEMWVEGRFAEGMGEQLYNAFLAFNYRIDNSRFYAGSVPMFLPLEAVAFLLGAMWAIWRWRTPASLLLLLLTVSTTVAGGALMFSPPHFTRYLVAVPALAILLALGLTKPLDVLAPGWGRRHAFSLALAGLLALGSVGYYFTSHLQSMREEFPPRVWQIRDVADRILSMPKITLSHVINAYEFDLHAFEVIQYLCPERTVTYHTLDDMDWTFVQQLSPGYHAFFISPGLLSEVLPVLQAYAPEGQIEPWYKTLPKGDPFILYRVNPGP